MQTRIANVIDAVGNQASYDACVKALLANRSILTWILKCCVDEFKPFDLNTIAECIKGTPEIATKPVHRNEEILSGNDEITGDNSEDSSATETKITYDLRFTAVVPNTEKPIELIVNVEAQKSQPAYDLEKRIIYYMSRLISSQYGTVFRHSEYGKIEKVYSIWFCVDVPNYLKNTITKLKINHDVVYGNPKLKPHVEDLMQGVIVNLGSPNEEEGNDILRLMNTLLSNTIGAEGKKRVLSEEFKIAMTNELESGVADMCNLSQSVLERGKMLGIKEGEIKGEMKNSIAVVRKMLAKGKLTVEDISEYSGLPITTILELKNGNLA